MIHKERHIYQAYCRTSQRDSIGSDVFREVWEALREAEIAVARLTGERDALQREFTTACQWYWRSVDPPGQNLESIMEIMRNEARNGR
jgi:hypothetical protein